MIDLKRAREILNSETPDCGDNSCRFALKISGMRTNGGCRCVYRSLTKATPVERYAVRARVFLPAALDEIVSLRSTEASLKSENEALRSENAILRKQLGTSLAEEALRVILSDSSEEGG